MITEGILKYIEYKANQLPIWEIVKSLVEILGKRMTIFLSGRSDESILNSWRIGTEKPTKVEELRLRYGYWAVAIINAEHDSETAGAIFLGKNPVLGDKAPVFWLRKYKKKKDLKLVVMAANEMSS